MHHLFEGRDVFCVCPLDLVKQSAMKSYLSLMHLKDFMDLAALDSAPSLRLAPILAMISLKSLLVCSL